MSGPFVVATSQRALESNEGWECYLAHTAEQAAEMGLAQGILANAWDDTITVRCPDGCVVQIEALTSECETQL